MCRRLAGPGLGPCLRPWSRVSDALLPSCPRIAFMPTIKSVCVYCGSSSRVREAHRAAARDLGRLLAECGVRLVFGGGRIGLMGLAADAALAAGGEVVGVIPRFRSEGHTSELQSQMRNSYAVFC